MDTKGQIKSRVGLLQKNVFSTDATIKIENIITLCI